MTRGGRGERGVLREVYGDFALFGSEKAGERPVPLQIHIRP